MIDENRVRQMAREYDMNPSTARRLLENARDVPALRIGRRYREMMGGKMESRDRPKAMIAKQCEKDKRRGTVSLFCGTCESFLGIVVDKIAKEGKGHLSWRFCPYCGQRIGKQVCLLRKVQKGAGRI